MKTLTIGSTSLELTSFGKRWDKASGVYAEIMIPTTAISHDDLKALFVDNQHDLIVTEEDGSTETYSGYAELNEIREKGGVYTVIQYCTGTAMHLLNEARKQITEQQATIGGMQNTINTQAAAIMAHEETIASQATVITAQGQTIASQSTEINNLTNTVNEQNAVITAQGETITTQSETIAAQSEQVTMLEESSVIQTATIDSLLLEIIPAVIADAVTVAVAEALASNSTTEESTEDSEVAE